jgi:phospholipid/cholesterol/gamma-HCH transport system substrate-binding protein
MRLLSRLGRSLKGRTGRQLAKLAVYAGLCLAVLAGLVARIGNIDYFDHKDGYQAVMPDVTGLLVNDAVKVAGVDVGKVTGIEVERGQAVVSFEVDPEVHLTTTTRVGVRWRNVLGQKYLYLYPGTGGKALAKGGRLPESQAVDSADVGAFLNAVGPILRAIDPAKVNAFIRAFNTALEDNEGKVRSLLSDTGDIATELGGRDQEIGALIDRLDTVVGGLADRNGDLNLVITRFKTLAQGMADNNDDLQLLVERFSAVQEKLDELVTRNRGNLDSTIEDLGTIARTLAQHRDELDRSLRTLPQGLAVYDQISSYGQWFQIRSKITCLANQRQCSDEALTSDTLAGGGPAGTAGDVVGFALTGADR